MEQARVSHTVAHCRRIAARESLRHMAPGRWGSGSMFGFQARRGRAARGALVLIQVFLLLFSSVGPTVVLAADPTPSDPPAAESPTPDPSPSDSPSVNPSATEAPTTAPTEAPTQAPTPEPTAAPDPTPSVAPDPTSTPAPDPTSTPAPAPTPAPVRPYVVTFASGVSAAAQVDALTTAGATDDDVIAVLRIHAVRASDAAVAALRADSRVASVEVDRSRDAEATPDDTAYGDQWSLAKIGWDQVYGTPLAGTAVVAVLDTGVDGSVPELSGQLVAGTSLLGGSPTSDPNGHGTAMASIVAARTNNGAGIAGVGYAGVKVMPVTVLGADGTGRDSDVIEGLVWAADHGADVALMAFSAPGYSSALQAAVDYAWSKGVVLVAATGNDGSSAPAFPAGDRGVVGVSSTDQNDALAASSNYGDDTFLAAPGVSIPAISVDGSVTSVSGTSAAAAHVAAAAALLRAKDAALSNGVVVGRLARTADAAGTAVESGNGRLNFARAFGDTSSGAVVPSGAAPVGSGGPFVGPYVASALGLSATYSAATTTITATATGTNQNKQYQFSYTPAGGSPTYTPCHAGSNQDIVDTFNLTT